ncbi:C-5 cytosine-specific DNA methylase [Nitrosomonas ureae]|uniref:C-5 cytosine-specific DNA methylase n=1 Tax=Nitrosomonas ureae TaxID=44577 RepID=A0A285C1A8_9PROT|nr:C-5 cytosine-specific DNA methylase [Nitrosomonas ureae]
MSGTRIRQKFAKKRSLHEVNEHFSQIFNAIIVPHSNRAKVSNHVNAIRRLTPIECERLQGFPDGWTYGISDSQRYQCCGNAVTVNVIRDIAERLLK